MNNLVKRFKTLVEIASPSGQESAIADYIKEQLYTLEFSVFEDDNGNILAKKGLGKPNLMFCAHMDTVEPAKGTKFKSRDGKLISEGETILGADNKAAIAAILQAVEDSETEETIELLFTVKEETGGGLADFPFTKIQSNICYIFDAVAPVGTVVMESPEIINFEITLSGKSAHISVSEDGQNAMIPATQVVQAIHKIRKTEDTKVNIGKFTSGTNINAVPGFALISGEIRSFNEKEFKEIVRKIQDACDKTAQKFGIETEVEFITESKCAGYKHSAHDLNGITLSEVFSKLAIEPILSKTWAVSDANILNTEGIMTINLGDGVFNAHTTEEYIAQDDLILMYEVAFELIDTL